MIIGGRYEIRAILGRGGMGEVYLAVDTRLHMKWAIKRIRLGERGKSHLMESFFAEANVLRSVRQENLVRIADIFKEGGDFFIVMEYVEGIALSEYMRLRPKEAARRAPEWGIQLLHALHAMHSRTPPIIYRDMKPENIIVRSDGTVCLIDFGTAKQLMDRGGFDRVSLGTRDFAAPEQYRGKSDVRSDLYSLSKTLLEASKGGNITGEWRRILKRGLNENPALRYKNTEEFERALRHYRFGKLRLAIIIAASVFILIAAAGLSYGLNVRQANQELADRYRRTIEEGNEALFRDDYETAERHFTEAVTEVDGSREEGYLCLLALYRKLQRAEEGLNRMDSYFDNDYGGSSHMNELLYNCGLAAFYDLSDYGRANRYFGRTDFGIIPEAAYFQELSELLSSFESNPEAILKIIHDFKLYIESCTDPDKRASDDILISGLCLILYDGMEEGMGLALLKEAAARSEEAMGLQLQRDLKTEYREESLNMLSAIYRLLGVKYPKKRKEYYETAISYTEEYLTGSMEDKSQALLRLLSMVRMYEEIGSNEKALMCYERYESLSDEDNKDVYIGHLKLLEKMGKYEEMRDLYRKSLSINGILMDPEFQRLSERMRSGE